MYEDEEEEGEGVEGKEVIRRKRNLKKKVRAERKEGGGGRGIAR